MSVAYILNGANNEYIWHSLKVMNSLWSLLLPTPAQCNGVHISIHAAALPLQCFCSLASGWYGGMVVY